MGIEFYMYRYCAACRSVITTLKYLNIGYKEIHIDILKNEQLSPEFINLNPLRQLPVIRDNGVILAESHAIMTYLVNKYKPESPLYPKDPMERATIDRILFFDASVFFVDGKEFLMPQLMKKEAPDPEKEKKFVYTLKLIDNLLTHSKYTAGDHLTLADLTLFSNMTFVEMTGYSISSYSNISNWFGRLKQEIPFHKEVNELPLKEFKSFMNL